MWREVKKREEKRSTPAFFSFLLLDHLFEVPRGE